MTCNRLPMPFVDTKTRDIVNAFVVIDTCGSREVVTVPAHISDTMNFKKDVPSGIWDQQEFEKRFKMKEA